MLADSYGCPVDFEITGGDVHEIKTADTLLRKVSGQAENFIADKGYDSEPLREQIRAAGATQIIPRKSNSKKTNPEFDSYLY